MKCRNNFLVSIVVIGSMGLASAQGFSKAGTSIAQFLKIPIGARAAGMGGSLVSASDDAASLYWNPASAATLTHYETMFSHADWIGGFSHNYIGVAVPLGDRSVFGFSAISLSSGDIEQTTIQQPEGTKTFYDAVDYAFGATYSRAMTDYVSIGVTCKYVNERIWNESASTIAFDLGALLKTGFRDLKLGLMTQNFGPTMKMDGRDLIRQYDPVAASTSNDFVETNVQTQESNLPTGYLVSASMSLIGKEGLLSLPLSQMLVTIDASHYNDGPEILHLGIEYMFMNMFAVRAGNVFYSDEEGFTLGVGARIPAGQTNIIFDYASAAFGVFGNVQHITIGLQF